MAERLFVYGTLKPEQAPAEVAHVVRRFRHEGPGSVRGRLFDLGDYPGVVLSREGELVRGQVYSLPSRHGLRDLDRYEEYDPSNKASSLFVRRRAPVSLEDGSVALCWIYEYQPEHQRVA